MNQIERIMSVIPQPSRGDIERLGAPYAMAILGQLPRRSGVGVTVWLYDGMAVWSTDVLTD